MKIVFATDKFFKALSLEEVRMGMRLIEIAWIEETADGAIIDHRGQKVASSIKEGKAYFEKKGYKEIPSRWDWINNMNPIENGQHLELLSRYFPYFNTKEAAEKLAKQKKEANIYFY